MLKRAVGWLKDKAGGGGRASGKKRSRDAYEEEQEEDEEVNIWADDHLMYACPSARQEQAQQHEQHSRPGEKFQPSLSSSASASEGEEICESYEDVDLSSDASDDGDDDSGRQKKTDDSSPPSPPPPSYFSFAAAAGRRPEALSSLPSRGPSERERELPLIKRARHTQTHSQSDGMLYLEALIATTTTTTTNRSSTTNNSNNNNISAIPDIYLDFWDVFDHPQQNAPSQQQQQQEHDQGSDDGDSGTVADGEEEEEDEQEEEELRRLADDKAGHDDDDGDNDDAHPPCSSPLFPPLAAKSEEVDASHHAQGGNGDAEFILTAGAAPAFGTSVRRPYHSASSSSPSTVIYTFTSELALRALMAPEGLGISGPGGKQSNEQAEQEEDEDEDSLFGRRPAKPVSRSGVLAGGGQSTSVTWERVEALVDCKVEVSEEGSCVAAGPDLQSSGVPLLFGIESETFWGMEELVCLNLYRSVDQLGTRSLLLLAKHASQRPPWAPERLEIVVVPLETKGHEQNAAAMLSLLSPAHARGPVKGGGLEAKLHVFEGRGELLRRPELPDLVALLEGHDNLLQRVGCHGNRNGSRYKRKQE